MPIDLPNSPANGDTYSAGGKTWQYDGTSWALVSGTVSIANNSVTTAKIADLAVTTAKIADLGVTTAKIADGSVTSAKMAAGAGGATGGLDTDAEGAITIMDIGA